MKMKITKKMKIMMKITKKKMMGKMKMKTNCKRDRSGRLISPTSGPDLLPPVITLLHLILLYLYILLLLTSMIY